MLLNKYPLRIKYEIHSTITEEIGEDRKKEIYSHVHMID